MTITLGSTLVHRAKLHVPWSGRWVVEVHFDGSPPSGKVTVQWGNTRLVGTVLPSKSGEVLTTGVATIIGGIGWQQEPPAAWLVDTVAGIPRVAAQLAQAVGETLVIGAGSLREGRKAYARANQYASLILQDLLAENVAWWVDFDGTTNTATDRPSSTCNAEVMAYEPESRLVKLDIDDPSQAPIGATIPAKGERFPIAQRIRQVDITADERGIECWAMLDPLIQKSRVAELIEQLVANAAPNPHAMLRGATVQSQGADRRVSLRFEERDKELADPLPVRAFCGVPGVSAEVFSGTRTLLAFDRADPTNPFAALWSPYGEAGHVPKKVFHEANSEIRVFAESAGTMRVGVATSPVALASNLVAYLNAGESWALQVDIILNVLSTALGINLSIAYPAYGAAVTARTNAASNLSNIPATKLEAE